jgi:hypothetical protein
MDSPREYYITRRAELLQDFDCEAERWRPVLSRQFDAGFAAQVIEESRQQYESLVPHLPYIGGEENQLTSSLIGSAQCLASTAP